MDQPPTSETGAAKAPALTRTEIVHLVGDLEDATVAAILGSGATYRDVETAAQYAAGTDEALGKRRLDLGPAAQAVYDILTSDTGFLGTARER